MLPAENYAMLIWSPPIDRKILNGQAKRSKPEQVAQFYFQITISPI